MKNLTPRMALACVLSLMLPAAALGQKTTNPEANVQQSLIYNDRGLAEQKKGDFAGAMADFNQAIKLNPKNAVAYDDRGVIKYMRGDLNGALEDFNHSLRLDPNFALPYNNRGGVKVKKSDLNGALAQLPHFLDRVLI